MRYLFNLLLVLLPCCICSCDNHNTPTSMMGKGTMELYGIEHPMTSASFWHFNPNSAYLPTEYQFIDKYTTSDGQSKSDTIIGRIVGDEHISSGNFVVSLYGDGGAFNTDLRVPTGKCAVLTIHFASPDINKLVSGTYKASDQPRPNTFKAYASSQINFSSNEHVNPAKSEDGFVIVSLDGDNKIHLSFEITLTTKAVLKGTYTGSYVPISAIQPSLVTYKGLSLYGFREKATVTETFFGSTQTKTTPDYKAKSFLSISSAQSFSASDLQKKYYGSDLALYYDNDSEEFQLISPILMRVYTGRLSVLDFLSYTKMSLAPDSFTDQDYEDLEKNGIQYEVNDAPVRFGIHSLPYIFVQTNTGEIAVIKILSTIPAEPYVNSQFNGMWVVKGVSAPGVNLEYKVVAQYKTPRIL